MQMLAVDFSHASRPLMAVMHELSEEKPIPATPALQKVAKIILAQTDERSVIDAIEDATGDADNWLPPRHSKGALVRKSSLLLLGDYYQQAVAALEEVPEPSSRPDTETNWQFENMIYRMHASAENIRDIAVFLAGTLSILVIEYAAVKKISLTREQAAALAYYIPGIARTAKKYRPK